MVVESRSLTCGQVRGAHVRSAADGEVGEHWFLQKVKKHMYPINTVDGLIHLEK